MISFKSLSAAMWGLLAIGVAFFALVIYFLIYPLVAGSIAAVATSSAIPLEGNWSAAIVNISVEGATQTTVIFSNTKLVISLIAIVVIMVVFGVGYIMYKNGKKDGGSAY